MKNLLSGVSILSIFLLLGCVKKIEERTIKVITFNIRYDNSRDSINAWPNRAGIVCEFLKSEKPDLLGLQEALWYQYEQIDSALTGYSSETKGRDDGKKMGEMNPVFYNVNRFEMVKSNTFWLSATPDRPGSKGWGASLPRIVTWVALLDKITHDSLYYFNTHFAHDSDSARIMSAGILTKEVKRIAGKNRFVITGDFNMDHESIAYSILTESKSSRPFLKDSYLVSENKPSGPEYTFNGWSEKPGKSRIDYVFVKKGMKVLDHITIEKKEGSVFISDHWPVMVKIR
jgi:endonuclease/exonuclease/phosphatase family metal-dependent hydrolase